LAFNVQGGVEVPLNTFGSLCTETAPEQLHNDPNVLSGTSTPPWTLKAK